MAVFSNSRGWEGAEPGSAFGVAVRNAAATAPNAIAIRSEGRGIHFMAVNMSCGGSLRWGSLGRFSILSRLSGWGSENNCLIAPINGSKSCGPRLVTRLPSRTLQD